MRVSEYITDLVTGEVGKLAIADVGDMSLNPETEPTSLQLKNQAKFLSYINQANLAVHKKFGLIQRDFEIDNPIDGEEYKLPTDFMAPISAYYAVDKEPVTVKDNSVNMVSQVDTAVSILIPEPLLARIKGTDTQYRPLIILRYSAAPKKAANAATDLKISPAYTDAILNYAAYKAHTAVSGGLKDENNTYYLRYEASCRELVMQGLHSNNEIETNTKLEDRGFI